MHEAKPVRLLSAEVSNKIAAGEVVERPASVLKELLENAIDSGATLVDAEIVAGGVRLVAVRDNGSGMGRDDAILAIERHATSKLREVEDIEKIGTLGFRGEALAAIASVSRFQLTTCLPGRDVGTCIRVSGGKLQDVAEAGCPAGTVIEVRDLFFNVPARRKFLRSDVTELANARTVFMLMALSQPSVGMNLRVDGRDVHRLPGGSSIEERIRDLFGSERIRELRPISRQAGAIRVHGFAGIPSACRGDRSEQFVFVNGRATSASVVGYAVKEAYHTLAPEGRFPVIYLFIELPPERVDVNVHPTKREVRFRDPQDVRDAVIECIRSALEMKGPVVRAGEAFAAAGLPRQASVERQLQIPDLPATRAFSYPGLQALAGAVASGEAKTRPAETLEGQPAGAGPCAATQEMAGSAPVAPWTWCRVVGQIGGLYVLLETEDGYVVMDPHAAHERVLYERYLKALESKTLQTQRMLIPETVEFGAHEADRLRRHLACIQEMGFDVTEFGADTFVVDAVPGCFAGVSARELLGEMARNIEEAGARGGKTRWREEAIAQSACKAAVKARDKLTLGEMEKLVAELAAAELPYTCPHGRPTMVFTSFKELGRKFGRE
jgi:DNA mismatch repair protein MutL